MQIRENEQIVKDVYEGGFQLWECTYDLIEQMVD